MPRRAALLLLAFLLPLVAGCQGPTAPYSCVVYYGIPQRTDANGNANKAVMGYQFCGSPPKVPAGFFLPDTVEYRGHR